MAIFLCGLPKSGKTVIGRKVAAHLKWDFLDTDQLIEEAFLKDWGRNRSCRSIYQEIGEKGFREMEHKSITSLAVKGNTIVSLGGGALELKENYSQIISRGVLVYLKASPDIVWGRIKTKGMPAFLTDGDPYREFMALANKRMPIYEMYAHASIDMTIFSRQQAVYKIIEIIGQEYGK